MPHRRKLPPCPGVLPARLSAAHFCSVINKKHKAVCAAKSNIALKMKLSQNIMLSSVKLYTRCTPSINEIQTWKHLYTSGRSFESRKLNAKYFESDINTAK